MNWPEFQGWQEHAVERQRARSVAELNAHNRERTHNRWYGKGRSHG